MIRDRSYKNADYPNAKPSWQTLSPELRKSFQLIDKREFYYKKLTYDSTPKSFIKNFRLYSKYARLTKSKIDPEKRRTYDNLIRTKKRYGIK